MKFRKKPVVIDAIQWDGKDIESIYKAFPELSEISNDFLENTLEIETLEGTMKAMPKDWIIKGVKGEFYPCKPDIFEATYEKVN